MKAEQLVAALGGVDNILEIEPCVTRLRIVLRDPRRLDADGLRRRGAHGVVVRGAVVQVVVGPQADLLASDIEELGW